MDLGVPASNTDYLPLNTGRSSVYNISHTRNLDHKWLLSIESPAITVIACDKDARYQHRKKLAPKKPDDWWPTLRARGGEKMSPNKQTDAKPAKF